jgi:hypothetical protein
MIDVVKFHLKNKNKLSKLCCFYVIKYVCKSSQALPPDNNNYLGITMKLQIILVIHRCRIFFLYYKINFPSF